MPEKAGEKPQEKSQADKPAGAGQPGQPASGENKAADPTNAGGACVGPEKSADKPSESKDAPLPAKPIAPGKEARGWSTHADRERERGMTGKREGKERRRKHDCEIEMELKEWSCIVAQLIPLPTNYSPTNK